MYRPLILFAAFFALAGCATKPPNQAGNACKIFEQKRGWYKATIASENKWDMPVSLQLAIIRQESSFNAKAKPGRKKLLFVFPGARISSAKGYAQALDGTWGAYIKETRSYSAKRSNFSDATDFIGWYGQKTRRETGVSTDDYYNQYLAYHLGQTGYLKGHYKADGTVRRIAQTVAGNAALYDQQLASCEKKLRNRGIPFIPGI